MTREAAVSHATDHVDSGRLQSELAHLVGYRSESQNPIAGTCRRTIWPRPSCRA